MSKLDTWMKHQEKLRRPEARGARTSAPTREEKLAASAQRLSVLKRLPDQGFRAIRGDARQVEAYLTAACARGWSTTASLHRTHLAWHDHQLVVWWQLDRQRLAAHPQDQAELDALKRDVDARIREAFGTQHREASRDGWRSFKRELRRTYQCPDRDGKDVAA